MQLERLSASSLTVSWESGMDSVVSEWKVRKSLLKVGVIKASLTGAASRCRCTVKYMGQEQKTAVTEEKTSTPVWNEEVRFEEMPQQGLRRRSGLDSNRRKGSASALEITVSRKGGKWASSSILGTVRIESTQLKNATQQGPVRMWFALEPVGGQVLLSLEFDFTEKERETYVSMLRQDVLGRLNFPTLEEQRVQSSEDDDDDSEVAVLDTSPRTVLNFSGGGMLVVDDEVAMPDKEKSDEKAEEEDALEDERAPVSAYNHDWEMNELLRFNRRFQGALEVMSNPQSEASAVIESAQELISVSQDFLFSARTYGRIIISERFLPDERKTIKPLPEMGGRIGGQKYVHCGVFYKFALGDDRIIKQVEHAMKVAGHELKGCSCYYNSGVSGLSVPLMALIDHKGFRLICMSILPIDSSTLVSGTPDGGRTIRSGDPVLTRKLRRAGRVLNLKPHSVNGHLMYSATDLEGHYVPEEKRHYLIDFSRVLPPEQPTVTSPSGSIFFRMLRAEFVARYRLPLSSDAFSGFRDSTNADYKLHENEVINACQDRDWILPNVAIALCTYVQTRVSDPEQSLATLQASLSRQIHSRGINMRDLGRLHRESRSKVCSSMLLIEMCARAVKTLLRRKMRAMMEQLTFPLEQPYLEEVVSFLNTTFGNPSSWESTIEPLVRSYFFRAESRGGPTKRTNLSYGDLNSTGRDSSSGNFDEPPEEDELPDDGDKTQPWRDCYKRIRAFPAGLGLLFLQMVHMMGLRFSPRVINEVTAAVARRATPALLLKRVPFDASDILELGERTKHLNVVPQAQAYVYQHKAKSAASVEDARHYYSLAIAAFEEALAGNPVSTVLLKSYVEVLMEVALGGPEGPSAHELRKIEEVFEQLLRNDPQNSASLGAFGEYLVKIGEMHHAQVYFLRAIMHGQSDEATWLWVERYRLLLLDLGLVKEAESFSAAHQEWLRMHPDTIVI